MSLYLCFYAHEYRDYGPGQEFLKNQGHYVSYYLDTLHAVRVEDEPRDLAAGQIPRVTDPAPARIRALEHSLHDQGEQEGGSDHQVEGHSDFRSVPVQTIL
jgi:hypothetical protein